jgi:two-component sensor histidine kinase
VAISKGVWASSGRAASQRLAFEIDTNNLMKASLELVNRELNHRVGNLLAVAQGIIGLSYNTSLSMTETYR